MLERNEYPNTYQLRAHVVTCKPGFDVCCQTIEGQSSNLYERYFALIWYIQNKPEIEEMPSDDGTYPAEEFSEWQEKLIKLHKEAQEVRRKLCES